MRTQPRAWDMWLYMAEACTADCGESRTGSEESRD